MSKTNDFSEVVKSILAQSPELADMVQEEICNSDIAEKIYEIREKSGMTQKQLAQKIGTRQSVISRIEDADYDKHSLTLLRRIAHALGKKVVVDFYDLPSYCKHTVSSEEFSVTWNSWSNTRSGGYVGELVNTFSNEPAEV